MADETPKEPAPDQSSPRRPRQAVRKGYDVLDVPSPKGTRIAPKDAAGAKEPVEDSDKK
jgi:hypothetical protein